MSPFLPTLLTVALAETANSAARTSQRLVIRASGAATPLVGLVIVSVLMMGFVTGTAIALHSFDPTSDQTRFRALLLGGALIWAAAGQFRIPHDVPLAEGQNLQIVALRSYARVMLISRSGLIVLGIGLIEGGDPITAIGAGMGGVLGLVAGSLPMMLLTGRQARAVPFAGLRIVAGLILAVGGFYFLLQALNLI